MIIMTEQAPEVHAPAGQASEAQGEEKVAETPKPKRSTRRKAVAVQNAQPAGAVAGEVSASEETAALMTLKKEHNQKAAEHYSVVEQLVFGKYNPKEVEIIDGSIAAYVNLGSYIYPNIYGRRKFLAYYTSHISVVERLINKLMRGGTGKKIGGKVIRTKGRLQGKKIKVTHVVEKAFGIVNRQTGKNPLQILINALQNSAPIEDTTRVRYGGISYNIAVGISAQRRINVALKNIALAALIGAFRNRRPLAEALANELMLAANNSPDSYAIKKRVEGERIAKRAR